MDYRSRLFEPLTHAELAERLNLARSLAVLRDFGKFADEFYSEILDATNAIRRQGAPRTSSQAARDCACSGATGVLATNALRRSED